MRFVCCFRMFKSTRREDLYLTYIILLISAIECILFRILCGGIRLKINTNLQYSSNFRLTLCIVLFPTGVYTQTHIYSPSDYFIFSYLRSTYRRALFEYQPGYWIWNRCLNLVLKKQQWTFLISHRPRWWRDYHHISEFHFRVVFNSVS